MGPAHEILVLIASVSRPGSDQLKLLRPAAPITFCNLEIGKHLMSTFANSEDPDEMQHDAAFHLGLHCLKGKKRSSGKRIQFFFNFKHTPINMYNGLSQVYCIEPEGRIHYYTKGKPARLKAFVAH